MVAFHAAVLSRRRSRGYNSRTHTEELQGSSSSSIPEGDTVGFVGGEDQFDVNLDQLKLAQAQSDQMKLDSRIESERCIYH